MIAEASWIRSGFHESSRRTLTFGVVGSFSPSPSFSYTFVFYLELALFTQLLPHAYPRPPFTSTSMFHVVIFSCYLVPHLLAEIWIAQL